MGLFSKKLVDRHVAEWQFESFEWLILHSALRQGLDADTLWLPTAEHFGSPDPERPLKGLALANFIFDTITRHMAFGAHAIKLTAVSEEKGGFLGASALIQTEGQSACGRYIQRQGAAGISEEITYDKDLAARPENLIATLAHELSHALHSRTREPLDIEPELYELFTDLTAVYMGYGIFLANSRFSFESNSVGWQAKGAGYLPEADLIFATAIFMAIKDLPQETAKPYLKPGLYKMLSKAFKQLSHYSDDIVRLRKLAPLFNGEPLPPPTPL